MADFGGVQQVLVSLQNTVNNAAKANPLADYGFYLLVSIITMLLIFQTLRTMLEGSSVRQLMSQFLYMCMLGSFASLLISDPMGVKTALINSTNLIAEKIAPNVGLDSNGGASDGYTAAYSAVVVLFKAAEHIWDSEAPRENATDNPANASNTETYEENAYDLDGNVIGTVTKTRPKNIGDAKTGTSFLNSIMSIGGFLPGLALMLLSTLIKIASIVILVLAGILALCQFIVSQILVYIALLLAPIFVPFLVWEQGSFMFDGWLRFFIKACFHRVVGLAIVGLLQATVIVALNNVENASVDGFAEGQALRFSALIGVLLIGCIIAYLMNQIGSIADGLISGSARAGYRFGGIPRIPSPVKSPDQPKPAGGQSGQKGDFKAAGVGTISKFTVGQGPGTGSRYSAASSFKPK